MYSRLLKHPKSKSFFLFGPRGTGKTHWLKASFPNAIYFDLLDAAIYLDFSSRPDRLAALIPPDFRDWIILDEVQRVPDLLNEVHRLIEGKGYKFILTGSSARRLRRRGVNLLAGRALTYKMHPLTCQELGTDFSLQHALQYGHLPATFSEESPQKYLESYIGTYLREEIQQEGLTRNLGAFARFLETASFSQGAVLTITDVAREAMVDRKVVSHYFDILKDLLLANTLPVFTKRAKRRTIGHPKFYFFDVGVFRAIRPTGLLDKPEEIDGAALETLVYQELVAVNDYLELEYELHYWRTSTDLEIDFILYGPRGLIAIEVKRSHTIHSKDLTAMRTFAEDYPEAKLFIFYGGQQREYRDNIQIIPMEEAVRSIPQILTS